MPRLTPVVLVGLSLLTVTAARATERPDVLIADFEEDSYGAWQAMGDAFGNAPARGTFPGQQPVSGFRGHGLVNSFLGGDNAQGTLRSPRFVLEREYVNLLVGGGHHPEETCVNLLVADQVVRTATGNATTGADDEHLSWQTWNVEPWLGQQAAIEIVDRHTGGWGHINVDHLVQSDRPEVDPTLDAQLARAASSVRGAAARAQSDPERPSYHFLPPALWNNDPNGPLFHEGFLHLFYQHNPYGDRWEHMHWGHARSRDLVHWEHLPIALTPSKERGEDHCFSGCAARNAAGELLLFYTSIGPREPEQWVATPLDRELLRWQKPPINPVLSTRLHGRDRIDDWRDPFVFPAGGRTFLVCGGHPHGGRGSIMLYEATDGRLLDWKYRGIAFSGEEANWECPNLFPLGDRFVLIYSPHGPVRYYVGQFDPDTGKFVPNQQGVLDASDDFYAPNGLAMPDGRWIHWGWVRNFPGGRGWNGCLTLPRELRLDEHGQLRQLPAREVEMLRGERRVALSEPQTLTQGLTPIDDLAGNTVEINATLPGQDGPSVALLINAAGEPNAQVRVAWEGNRIEIDHRQATLELPADEPLKLRVFVDRSVVEVYANDRVALTKVVPGLPERASYAWEAKRAGTVLESCEAWLLKSAWQPIDAAP